MNVKRISLLGILCLSVILLCACSQNGVTPAPPSPSQIGSSPGDRPEQSKGNASEEKNQGKENPGGEQSQDELEKSLADFRAEREKMTGVKMGHGVSGYGSPNLEDYGIEADVMDYTARFDSRELAEAYGSAEKYAESTLKLKVETNMTVYTCIDPGMTAIYTDEDKGVASGYSSDNIFVCEYSDNGNWQYLILVRDKKGEPWKGIHHGSSYHNN